ncbi:MAG: hypothetical protein COV35_02840 [Alphaproteobacteria bacterium CG11_big_fil_rev_8_21_14_0_20_39_49]|nr:MAG: hypothetical protein COV35_02840 [Alphaproteobacteria bacterium CG11_big_fil_rev_8_21_14_0_20_39_49]
MILKFILRGWCFLTLSFVMLSGGESAFASVVRIDAVYFGQTHISEPEYPYFTLTSNRPTLIKAHVVSEQNISSPKVIAKVTHNDGTSNEFELNGSSMLPHSESLPSSLGKVFHRYEDSFTGILPKEWVQPGMEITVTAGDAVYNKKIKVGSPNPLFLQMFDVHFFDRGHELSKDYADGVFVEIAGKLPISSLAIERVRDVRFPGVVIPAQPKNKTPHIKVSSLDEYGKKTGEVFDDWNSIAMNLLQALAEANGNKHLSVMYMNMIGVEPKGYAADDFMGVGQIADHDNLFVSLGYSLGLLNWQDKKNFPYRGEMYGIEAQNTKIIKAKDMVHVGPVWGYDLTSMKFIPPTVQYGKSTPEEVGRYKREPMEGGGSGDQDNGFMLRHFSDYSVHQMQKYLEDNLVILGEDGNYYKWNNADGIYSTQVKGEIGIEYPLEIYADVISVIVSATVADKRYNMVYPPIGTYRGNLLYTFDPTDIKQRKKANQLNYCPKGGCDFTLKVVQESKTRHFLMPISVKEGDDRFKPDTLHTKAINIRASDGAIEAVSLLYTPDANETGLGENPEFLHGWAKNVVKR